MLDGAPSLVDNPRQLALERSRKEQRKRESEIAAPGTGGVNGMVQIAGGRASSHGGAGTQNTRVLQVESRGKSGKRRIQPVLLSNGGGGVSGSGAGGGSSAPPLALPDTSARWQGAPGAGTVSEGFGPNATAGTGGTSSPRLGHKRPRISAGSGASHSRQHTVGVRSRDGVVVRLRAAGGGGSASSLVSPPELMPRRGATGSLVRQIEGRSVGGVGQGEGNGAFRPSPRIRDAPSSSIVVAGMPDDHGVRSTGDGGSGIAGSSGGSSRNGGSAVMECSALDEDFRGLPARRYTVVAVTRGGREVWRDYVAGMATACCGNARVAAVGAEDGSVYVYDRYVRIKRWFGPGRTLIPGFGGAGSFYDTLKYALRSPLSALFGTHRTKEACRTIYRTFWGGYPVLLTCCHEWNPCSYGVHTLDPSHRRYVSSTIITIALND